MGNGQSDNQNQKQISILELMEIIKTRFNSIYKVNSISNQQFTEKYQHINLFLQKFKKSEINSFQDRIFGCLFGSLIGDALGAYCEFNTKKIDQKTLNKAMLMKGGGVFGLRPGQFTDDSQMSYHLLKGLSKIDENKSLKDQENELLLQIGREYIRWSKSKPFDIGITCKNGIQILNKNLQTKELDNILTQVSKINNKSQSNGSLMRITPMALFFNLINQQPEQYKSFIIKQIRLLHPNPILTQAGYIWVVILFNLARRNDNSIQTFKKILKHAEEINQNQQLKNWFQKSKQQKRMEAVINMGWAKIAWTYGINILYKLSTNSEYFQSLNFQKEIKSVILQAGDSDTNACIVGGIMGALLGFKSLPIKYLQKLMKLSFETKQNKEWVNDRPKQYEPINVFITLIDFIQICKRYKKNHSMSSKL